MKNSEVKIGARTYTIEFRGRLSEECLGLCFLPSKKSRKGTILIRTGQRPSGEFDTIIHEVLHAICHARKLDLDDELEEKIVKNLAHGLTDFFKKNPAFTKGLMELVE